MEALQTGLLSALRERVAADRSLCLEIRENYINIYYRGGNLMNVSHTGRAYKAGFDTQYFETKYSKGAKRPAVPPEGLRGLADVDAWLAAFPWLRQSMDFYFGEHPKDEREIQQMLLRENNIGRIARSTDYYVCDIEYANTHGRFDLVAVHWPSTVSGRKQQSGRRLVLAEVKYGDAALKGKAGLHEHIEGVNKFLSDPSKVAKLKREMACVFNQKRALNLVNCGKDLEGFSDEPPLLLLVLANHDPSASHLRGLLHSLPACPHAELRVATGCLLGYGLYDPAILTVEQASLRFEDCI